MRLRISENILSFSNHMTSFNNNETAKVWFPYVQDELPLVRWNIANAIKGLLMNKMNIAKKSIENDVHAHDCLDEFAELLIDTIARALVNALSESNHALHDTLLVTAKNSAL